MKKFVIGDIHGNFRALKQCLERSKFNYEEDKLIVLGDTCDGFPDVKECFDELLKIKNLIHILGNHDNWALKWYTKDIFSGGFPEILWTSQGGQNTINSYGGINERMGEKHLSLLINSPLYHLEYNYDDIYLFVHGGINPNQKDIVKQDRDVLLWDRELLRYARHKHYQNPNCKYGGFDRIYVGHTTTQMAGKTEPMKYCNVIMMDTGAGWNGKLTIMNIETNELYQSDLCKDLYPEGHGRE